MKFQTGLTFSCKRALICSAHLAPINAIYSINLAPINAVFQHKNLNNSVDFMRTVLGLNSCLKLTQSFVSLKNFDLNVRILENSEEFYPYETDDIRASLSFGLWRVLYLGGLKD